MVRFIPPPIKEAFGICTALYRFLCATLKSLTPPLQATATEYAVWMGFSEVQFYILPSWN